MNEIERRLRAAADDLMRWYPVPGGVAVVAGPGPATITVPFGHAEPSRHEPVTGSELYEIGSISKLLTALLVVQLADDGRLALDDPATAHLPWFDAGPHTRTITVRHLLSHTAGLVGGSDPFPDGTAQVWSLRHRAATTPGDHFHYSNVGYLALGEIVTAVGGEAPWQLLERRVLAPLGMDGALARVGSADRPRLAVGSTGLRSDRPWLPGDALVPATFLAVDGADGNVALDAAHLSTLLRLLLSDGAVDGRRVVSVERWHELTAPTAPGGEDVVDRPGGLPVTASRYALGVNVERIGGATCLTHGGGMVGYASFVLADPGHGIAAGVITNADGDCLAPQLLARYAHHLARAAAGGEPLPEPTGFDPRVPAVDLSSLAGDALRGTAADGEQVELTVTTGPQHVQVHGASAVGALFRGPDGRLATDHPALRGQFLHREPVPASGPVPTDDQIRSLTGRYRSHTPWFGIFRIVARSGRLFLTACRGVEAPAADLELVPLGPDTFRIGADDWLPERLTVRARAGGRAVLVDLDGCGYSRTETV